MKTNIRNRTEAAAASLLAFFCALSQAQTRSDINPPQLQMSTVASVNMLSGWPTFQHKTVSMGGELGISHNLLFSGWATVDTQFKDSFKGEITKVIRPGCLWYEYPDCGHIAFSFGSSNEIFIENSQGFAPFTKSGSRLSRDSSTGGFIYTSGDGTKYIADLSISGERTSAAARDWVYITQVIKPNGLKFDITYASAAFVNEAGQTIWRNRISSVRTNSGYQLRYKYESDAYPTLATSVAWQLLTAVTLLNSTVDYCDDLAPNCSYSELWPTTNFARTSSTPNVMELSVTDQAGGLTKYFNEDLYQGEWRVTKIKPPSSTANYVTTFTYDSYFHCSYGDGIGGGNCNRIRPNIVKTATGPSGVTTFSYQKIPGPSASLISDHPLLSRWETSASHNVGRGSSVVFSNSSRGGIETANLGGASFGKSTANYTDNLLTEYYSPDGAHYGYIYDERGNVKQRTQYHETDPSRNLAIFADFDLTCISTAKCNQPNWVQDARGAVTNYTYDSAHGGLLKETSPPGQSGIRPETRHTYVQRYAWIRSPTGGFVRADTPIWLLHETSSCKSGSAASSGSGCSIPGDEVLTRYDYGPDAGPNNLRVRGVSIIADGIVSRTCFAYDAKGNKISETSANAGLASCL